MPFCSILKKGVWSHIRVVSPASFSNKSQTVSFESLPRVFLLFHMRPVCLLSPPLSSLCSCPTSINAIQAKYGPQAKTRHVLNHRQEQCGGGKSMMEESGISIRRRKRETPEKWRKRLKKCWAHCEKAWTVKVYQESSVLSLGWKQSVAVSKLIATFS